MKIKKIKIREKLEMFGNKKLKERIEKLEN